MDKIKQLLNKLLSFLKIAESNSPTPQGEAIFKTALKYLNTDVSPNDIAPDEYGCAESVSNVIIKAGFSMPIIVSTAELYKFLLKADEWLQIEKPLRGDCIISPTGMGGKNGILNGHTGILGDNGVIMSNNSFTGNFEPNYTIPLWKARYTVKGGYPLYFFRRVV